MFCRSRLRFMTDKVHLRCVKLPVPDNVNRWRSAMCFPEKGRGWGWVKHPHGRLSSRRPIWAQQSPNLTKWDFVPELEVTGWTPRCLQVCITADCVCVRLYWRRLSQVVFLRSSPPPPHPSLWPGTTCILINFVCVLLSCPGGMWWRNRWIRKCFSTPDTCASAVSSYLLVETF